LLAAICALLHLAPAAFAQPTAAIAPQARFEQGLRLLLEHDYAAAARVFEQLYAATGSERVRLEWARAAYLMQDYDKAKALFMAVLASEPPLPVREKINFFLEDISLAQGRLDYSVSLVQDSNPRAIPSVRTFNIFGLPFEYRPQVDTSRKWGLNYRLLASKGLDNARRWVASAGVLGTHFGDPAFNKAGWDVHLAYRFAFEPRIELRASHESQDLGADPFYRYAWLTFTHSSEPFRSWRLSHEVRHGSIDYPLYTYQNSVLTSYRLISEKGLSPHAAAGFELGWDQGRAIELPYSHTGHSYGVMGTYFLDAIATRAQLKWSAAHRLNAAADPMFGIRREDRRQSVTLTLESSAIRLAGLTPVFEFGYEKNDSTLALINYDRTIASVTFRKTY